MVNETFTDENGTCTITGVEKGSDLTLTISKEGFKEATETITNVGDNQSLNISLEADTETDNEDLVTRNVKFTVQREDEEKVRGVRITLSNTSTEEEFVNGNGGTGSSGGSELSDVPYGEYNVALTIDEEVVSSFGLTVDETLSLGVGTGVTISNDEVIVTLTDKSELVDNGGIA